MSNMETEVGSTQNLVSVAEQVEVRAQRIANAVEDYLIGPSELKPTEKEPKQRSSTPFELIRQTLCEIDLALSRIDKALQATQQCVGMCNPDIVVDPSLSSRRIRPLIEQSDGTIR